MTEEDADLRFTTVYQGRVIGFCCDKCLAKFAVNPDRYLANIPELTAQAQTGEDGERGKHDTAVGRADEDNGRREHADDAGHDDAGHEDAGDVGEPVGHSHAEAAAEGARLPLLARIHPALVHFPVAGVPVAFAGLCVWLVSRRRPALAAADVPPLLLAALASIAAVITGNIAHDSMTFTASLHDYVEWHETSGTTLMIVTLVLSALRLWRWGRLSGGWLGLYAGGLAAATILAAVTGFLGGSLVFGPDHLLP